MFVGHFAVALAATRVVPGRSLGGLVAASFAADITEAIPAIFWAADPTRAWSHSVPATAVAGLVVALIATRNGVDWRYSVTIISVALSHSALDFVTAVKAYWPGVAPAGLGLYDHPVATAVLELAAAIIGWLLWRGGLPAARRGRVPAWGMLAVLVGAQLALVVHLVLFGPGVDAGALSKFVR